MLHKKFLQIVNIFCFLAICLILVNHADAQINACNTDVTGKNIKWDSSWNADGKDNGAVYKIVRATELKKDKVIMFELVGSNKSFVKSRDLLVQSEKMMKSFCEKIYNTNATMSNDNSEIQVEGEELEQFELLQLPHIKYAKGGWQRADTPRNQSLSSCVLLGKTFSCTSSDKKLHLDKLGELESEVKLMEELGY